MPGSTKADTARLTELKHFLRARRAAIAPADVGLAAGSRRRTPGLRRDEVAQLAGIGATWYTFLEQGRNVRASGRVLDRLAAVFALNAAERRYLHELALGATPAEDAGGPPKLTEGVRALLAMLDPAPAYVLNRYFDVVAGNASAELVFDFSDATPGHSRNVIRRLVLDPAKRELHRDWEVHVRNTIAAFRPNFSRDPDDPAMRALVEELSAQSEQFRAWWSQHDVLVDDTRLQRVLHLDHPRLGPLAGRFTLLSVFGQPHLTLCVFTPEASTQTAAVIRNALR